MVTPRDLNIGDNIGNISMPTKKYEVEIAVPTVPDGGYGWLVVCAAFLAHVITHGILYSFGVLFITIQKMFGGNKAEVSWILSIATGMVYLIGPAAGYLAERYGIRMVTITGAVLGAIGSFLSMFASSLVVLYVTLGFITGCGFGMVFLGAIVIVTTYFNKRRSLASGIGLSGAGIGAFIFSPLLDTLTNMFSLKGTLLILSGIILNCIACGFIFKPVNSYTLTKSTLGSMNGDTDEEDGEKKTYTGETDTVKKCDANDGDITPVNKIGNSVAVYIPYASKDFVNDTGKRGSFKTGSETGESGTLFRDENMLEDEQEYPNLLNDRTIGVHIEHEDFLRQDLPEQTVPLVYKDESILNEVKRVKFDKEVNNGSSVMRQLDLFRNKVFDIFVISQFLFFFGFYLPFFFIPDMARETGISEGIAVWAVSTIGISSILGRIVLGYIADRPSVNRLLIFEVALLVSGVSTAFGPLLNSTWSLFVYAPIYGISTGIILSLTPVLLADLLGIERLATAFGINNFFCGVASLIGPPIAGLLYDQTGSYTVSFLVAGISMSAAALLMFLIRFSKSKSKTENVFIK